MGSAGFVGRWVGARFECRPVTSKQHSPASAAAVPTRGQAEPQSQFTSAMPRDDGGGMPRLRSATGLRGAKQSLEPQRQLTLAMRWCRRGRGGRRRAREARARGRGLGRKRGLWRHIEYVWRAQAAEGAGLPGAATERLSTGTAKAWRCVASATFCYLVARPRRIALLLTLTMTGSPCSISKPPAPKPEGSISRASTLRQTVVRQGAFRGRRATAHGGVLWVCSTSSAPCFTPPANFLISPVTNFFEWCVPLSRERPAGARLGNPRRATEKSGSATD